MKKRTLYYHPSEGKDIVFAMIDVESGEILATHFCSHEDFAPGDLLNNRTERKEKLIKKYGVDDIEIKPFAESGVTEAELEKRMEIFYKNKEKE